MRPLPPAEARALAVRLLETRGFALEARNDRGDSIYLHRDGAILRVSNHARTPRQRRRHPDVAASLVIAAPRSPAQVAAMVAAAERNVRAGGGDRGST